MYLEVGYHVGSIVLLTSRSLDMLKSLGISECDCIEMPELEEKGAIDLFLYYTGRSKELPINENEKKIIKRCAEECNFLKNVGSMGAMKRVYQYLPLALKTLGSQLRSISDDVLRWEEILKKVEGHKFNSKFNLLKSKIHPIFSILRLGFDALCQEEQHIFLDMALLFLPKKRYWYYEYAIGDINLLKLWRLFCTIHRKGQDEMKEAVNGLRRKGLLDKVSEVNEFQINIHDLYLDFAEAEAGAGPFERRRFLIDKGGVDVLLELLKNPCGLCYSSLERLIIHRSKVQSLGKAKLHLCSNVEVLELFWCEELEEVDVGGMDNLRSVEIVRCRKLARGLVGIGNLNNLVVFRWLGHRRLLTTLEPSLVRNLTSLTTLENLELHSFTWSRDMFPLNLSACTNLLELSLRDSGISETGINEVLDPPDFGNLPQSLKKIDFSGCDSLVGSSVFCSLRLLTNLQYLNLQMCRKLTVLTCLSELINMKDLNICGTNISELPDLKKCKKLEVLNVYGCEKLTSIAGIVHVTTLQHVNARNCRNLKEVPDDLSSLEKLETLDLSWSWAINMLPKDYKRLARFGIIKIEGCWGLICALVQELQRPHRLQDEGLHSIGCVSRVGKSMQFWIETMKGVNSSAYNLLKHVVTSRTHWMGEKWPYLLNHGETDEVLVWALCEHGDMGSNETNRLSHVLAQLVHGQSPQWWAVVATAPCTFEVVMERAMLEPWNKTLLHYTIVTILPWFLLAKYNDNNSRGETNWLVKGIEVVLEKCKEMLKEAIDLDIDHVRSVEGQEVVDILSRELEAKKYSGEVLNNDWILTRSDRVDLLELNEGRRYCDMYPNFPFGKVLALQNVFWDNELRK